VESRDFTPLTVRRYLPHALVGLMLLLALTAGGVGAAMGVARHTAAPAATVLHYANEGTSQLSSLDPATGFDLNTRQAAQIIYGGLTRFGPNFQVLPDTAQTWTITDHGRSYTFHLRPDVRFADGTVLTAGDVAYSLNRTLSPRFANQSGAFILKNIEGASRVTDGQAKEASGIQVVDAHTLRIRLLAADGSFLAKLATPAGYIVSASRDRSKPPWLVPACIRYRSVHGQSLDQSHRALARSQSALLGRAIADYRHRHAPDSRAVDRLQTVPRRRT